MIWPDEDVFTADLPTQKPILEGTPLQTGKFDFNLSGEGGLERACQSLRTEIDQIVAKQTNLRGTEAKVEALHRGLIKYSTQCKMSYIAPSMKCKDSDFLDSTESLCVFASTKYQHTRHLDAEVKRVFGGESLFEGEQKFVKLLLFFQKKTKKKKHQYVFYLLGGDSPETQTHLDDVITLLHNLKILATASNLKKLVFCSADPLFSALNLLLFHDLLHYIFKDSDISIQLCSYPGLTKTSNHTISIYENILVIQFHTMSYVQNIV